MKKFLIRLWREEEGQSMVEYILMLSIVLMIFFKFKSSIMEYINSLIGNVGSQLNTAVSQSSPSN